MAISTNNLFVIFIFSVVYIVANASDTPAIGILSQETYIVKKYFPGEKHSAFIAASTVKFLESAGARVVPVWIGQNESYYQRVVKYTNGLVFPGGGTYFNESGGYGEAAAQLYKLAVEANRKGVYYPIWGICLGLQVMFYGALDGEKDIRVGCNLKHVSLPLNFSEDFRDSRLFSNISENDINALESKNITYNLHRYCITKAVLKENNLSEEWKILATNLDDNKLEFVSAVEHKKLPFYGVQFHPEKNQFEFKKNVGFPHSVEAVRTAQYFANFFVDETRRNDNMFPDDAIEQSSLIYNFNPRFTGANNGYYEQIYVFAKNDFQRVQLE